MPTPLPDVPCCLNGEFSRAFHFLRDVIQHPAVNPRFIRSGQHLAA